MKYYKTVKIPTDKEFKEIDEYRRQEAERRKESFAYDGLGE